MRKSQSITPTKTVNYRRRSFIFPNKLYADLEAIRTTLDPPPSTNKLVRKILELYINKAK